MSPGAETDLSSVYLAVNSTADYEGLYALDVLGLVDTPMGDQGDVYDELRNSYRVLPKDGMKPHCPVGWCNRAAFRDLENLPSRER